ncbi:MAG: DNA polymerase I, partial [Candidatus Cloacimonetes bacterium]|nr:DNA polymerase I [Candidatus Cloacimonadota bacterium]
VLFDELSLPVIKKTKTQRSTDESVLKKLKGLHPCISPLLRYRELFKLKTGFVDPLPQMTDNGGRIHTTFNQARTTTGRLSSENPNLQNIPLDPKIGLRKAFVAPPGSKLLVADYSQVELRIIAHYSGDSNLITSFEKDQDIHAATAARIFNCFIDEVTLKQRQVAKTMNFAVMYGMSAHGLSDVLEVEYIKAQKYIDEYFENYPGMKAWLEETVRKAHEQGIVSSLMGRRRLIPELSSNNSRLRWAGERMAVNMPIQGTAADLIKLAMVKIEQRAKSKEQRAKMLLQVHDELVFEVPEDEIEEVGKLVKEEMEGAMKLRVPLKVDLKVGESWGELEELKA